MGSNPNLKYVMNVVISNFFESAKIFKNSHKSHAVDQPTNSLLNDLENKASVIPADVYTNVGD